MSDGGSLAKSREVAAVALTSTKARLKRSSSLHRLAMEWRSRSTGSKVVRPGRTDIVIDGYPRSGNGYAVVSFMEANPDVARSRIVHHTHSRHTVNRAVRLGIPALVVIRDPVDAVSSRVISFGVRSSSMIDVAAAMYIDFYDGITDLLDSILLVPFEDLISVDFRELTASLNRRFDTSFNEHFDPQVVSASVRSRLGVKGTGRHSPLPREDRSRMLAALRPAVEGHPTVRRAVELHRQLRGQI